MGMLPSRSTAGEKLWFSRCWCGKGRALDLREPSAGPRPLADAVGPWARSRASQSLSLPIGQVGTLSPCRGRREAELYPLRSALQTWAVTSLRGQHPGPFENRGLLRVRRLPLVSHCPSILLLAADEDVEPQHRGHTKRGTLPVKVPLSGLKDSHRDLSSHPGSGARWWQIHGRLLHN